MLLPYRISHPTLAFHVFSPADFGKFRKLDERMMQGADDALTQGARCWALRACLVCTPPLFRLLPPLQASPCS